MKKNLKKHFKKIIGGILTLVIILKAITPIVQVFAQNTHHLTIDFNDGSIDGNVITYTVGETEVTATIDGEYTLEDGVLGIDEESWVTAITIDNYDSETMQVRVYEPGENGFQATYSYEDGVLIRDEEGGLPDSFNFIIEERTEGHYNFDGRAVVLWSCGEDDSKVCYHEFSVIDPEHCDPEHPESEACAPEIGNFDNGNSTFFKDTTIEADNRPGETFNVDARYREWYLTDEFYAWQDLYEIATNNPVDWDTLEPEIIMGDPNQHINELVAEAADVCGEHPSERCINEYAARERGEIWTHELQPVGEPSAKNAYVSYGDRNFKVVIFNDDYRGVTTGDLTGLTYYPARWVNPYLRTDQYDISETTESKPALLDSILLESTVNINALNYNGFEIASITPLEVPEDAVTVDYDEEHDRFSIIFSSHFYDNVVFRITDTDDEDYYVMIKRATIDAYFDYNEEDGDILRADFYYAKNKSYTDFDITAKIVYKDGSTKMVTLTPQDNVDDGLGNFSDTGYIDQEYPDSRMDPEHDEPMGKGLKLSTFRYVLEEDEKDTIQDIYMNAEYKGNDPTVYAGAYSGSGEGTLANIFHPEEVNQ